MLNETISIPDQVSEIWQKTVDLLARVVDVPSAIITRVFPPYIEVFRASSNEQNPYHAGQKVKMAGHYCQQVISSEETLLLPNAHKSEQFKNAPEIKYDMISYLGYPVYWPTGEVFGTICVLDSKENYYSQTYQELLQQFRLLVELNLQSLYENFELRNLNATKDKLFSIISHDLRAPFLTLVGLSDMLRNQPDDAEPEETQNLARIINEAAKSCQDMLENLLQWSRIQTNRIKPEPAKLALREVADYGIKLLAGSAAEKKMRIINEIEQDKAVFADKNVLISIIQNLLSNAIKFTPEGGKVFISAENRDNLVHIGIRDTGIGMSETQLRGLFDINSTETTLGTNGEKGTGLGLILIKDLVERSGGSVTVSSEQGKGTLACFTMPVLRTS